MVNRRYLGCLIKLWKLIFHCTAKESLEEAEGIMVTNLIPAKIVTLINCPWNLRTEELHENWGKIKKNYDHTWLVSPSKSFSIRQRSAQSVIHKSQWWWVTIATRKCIGATRVGRVRRRLCACSHETLWCL